MRWAEPSRSFEFSAMNSVANGSHDRCTASLWIHASDGSPCIWRQACAPRPRPRPTRSTGARRGSSPARPLAHRIVHLVVHLALAAASRRLRSGPDSATISSSSPGRSRTDKSLRTRDFKSPAFTVSPRGQNTRWFSIAAERTAPPRPPATTLTAGVGRALHCETPKWIPPGEALTNTWRGSVPSSSIG